MRISHLVLLALVLISIGMYMSDQQSMLKPTADIASLELVNAPTPLIPDTPIDPEIRGQALDFVHELASSTIPPLQWGKPIILSVETNSLSCYRSHPPAVTQWTAPS
ncbi:MAG TPA: hypothetical protein DD979_03790 [Gammaproteobacteria bacterium]|nr:hypothetical protein [Gammaproteobacteria bacterium]